MVIRQRMVRWVLHTQSLLTTNHHLTSSVHINIYTAILPFVSIRCPQLFSQDLYAMRVQESAEIAPNTRYRKNNSLFSMTHHTTHYCFLDVISTLITAFRNTHKTIHILFTLKLKALILDHFASSPSFSSSSSSSCCGCCYYCYY